jgi:hypothetical protein
VSVLRNFNGVWHKGIVRDHVLPSVDHALAMLLITYEDGDSEHVYPDVAVIIANNFECNAKGDVAGLIADTTAAEMTATAAAAAARAIAVAHAITLKAAVPHEYALESTWLDIAHAPLRAANLKILEKFHPTTGQLRHLMTAYKSARLAFPDLMNSYTPADIDNMIHAAVVFPFIGSQQVETLLAQKNSYIERARNCADDMDDASTLLFWFKLRNDPKVSEWHAFFISMCCQCVSEAACERLFSVLQNSFDDRQGNVLRDYLEAKCLCRYNSRAGQ